MSKSDLNCEHSQCQYTGLSYCSVIHREAGILACHTEMVNELCKQGIISYIASFPLSSLIYAMYHVYMNCIIMKTINRQFIVFMMICICNVLSSTISGYASHLTNTTGPLSSSGHRPFPLKVQRHNKLR